MQNSNISKSSFNYDDKGRAILGSAKEMAKWVRLKFEEQERNKRPDIPFWKPYIDLRNCVLFVSYPIDSEKPTSKIFNLCDIAGIVPGIEKINGDSNYLFEVKYDILLGGSELYGNYFHYVKFDGRVCMDNVTDLSGFSCFRCHFSDVVYMQDIQLEQGFTFEQCEFDSGLVMTAATVGGINASFNNCHIKDRLSLVEARVINKRASYPQKIEISNSEVNFLNISKINTDGIPLYITNTSIHSMKMNNVSLNNTLYFDSCPLDGIITSVIDDGAPNNRITQLIFHSCDVKAQCHIENSDIEKFVFHFCKVDNAGRLRFEQCGIGEFVVESSSVFGQMDIIDNKISEIGLDETCVHGYLNYQRNDVEKYSDRQTLRLLKNEALKVNDHVSATQLYAKEMKMLLSDKSVSRMEKVSLWINRLFSGFGANWIKALVVTLGFSIVLTILMLGIGSSKYGFEWPGDFMGFGPFVTALLDSINVFSIPMFSTTIETYGLNVVGQILYFIIKIVVAYGTYQFVVAFRKYGR